MEQNDRNFFRDWMDERRLKAEDVAGLFHASIQTIHNWRSSGVPDRRRPHVEQFMAEWVDPVSQRAGDPNADAQRLGQLLIRVTGEQFNRWNHAANNAPGGPFLMEDWAIRALEEAAYEYEAAGKQPELESVLPFILPDRSAEEAAHWIDLAGGVAAGSPIASDAPREPIPVPREFPEGHYALRVFGQSMEPKIPDGSIIIVKRLAEGTFPKKTSIVVYSDAYGHSLKELGYRAAKGDEEANAFGKVAVLKSLNPRFPDVQTIDSGRLEAVWVETL